MVDQLLDIFEIAFGLFGLCSLAVGAWFKFCEVWQTDEERAKTRASYGKKWEAIRDTGLLRLPENAIKWVLDAKTRLADVAIRPVDRVFGGAYQAQDWVLFLFLAVPFIGGAAGGWITYGWIGAVALASAFGIVCAILLVYGDLSGIVPTWQFYSVLGLWGAACLFTAATWLNMLLGLDIACAAGVMFILLPVYMLILAVPFGVVAWIGDDTTSWGLFDENSWTVFGTATAVSFFVTLCSLLIGSLVAPEATIPNTLQMLLCNVVFDGFTMVATFAILARAVGERRKYPIPVAILIDVVVAALFACASLWLGLIGTEHALSIKQVVGVLIAKSAEDAGRYALGPYFWAMHTTFLPTLGYLGLILLFWIAKLVVLPVASFFKRSSEIDKPHSLMAGLFGFVGATSLVAAAILHLANNDTPNRPTPAPAQVVEDAAKPRREQAPVQRFVMTHLA